MLICDFFTQTDKSNKIYRINLFILTFQYLVIKYFRWIYLCYGFILQNDFSKLKISKWIQIGTVTNLLTCILINICKEKIKFLPSNKLYTLELYKSDVWKPPHVPNIDNLYSIPLSSGQFLCYCISMF